MKMTLVFYITPTDFQGPETNTSHLPQTMAHQFGPAELFEEGGEGNQVELPPVVDAATACGCAVAVFAV